jgi:hypothetical protein
MLIRNAWLLHCENLTMLHIHRRLSLWRAMKIDSRKTRHLYIFGSPGDIVPWSMIAARLWIIKRLYAMDVKLSMSMDSAFIALCRVWGCPKVCKYKVNTTHVLTYDALKHVAFDLIYVADQSFVFPNPYEDRNGFEPPGYKPVRGTQDRYGHAAVVDTPEKEKQRKGRFPAQSTKRKKRGRHWWHMTSHKNRMKLKCDFCGRHIHVLVELHNHLS